MRQLAEDNQVASTPFQMQLCAMMLLWSMLPNALAQQQRGDERQKRTSRIAAKTDTEGNITVVYLDGDISQETADEIGSLSRLQTIAISGCSTRHGVGKVLRKASAELERLTVYDSVMADAELIAFLQQHKKIRHLDLLNVGITSESLQAIGKLGSLRILRLSGTKITDKGLGGLAPLPKLFSLDLSATSVSDKGLNTIGRMKTLSALYLDNTKVTDSGLNALKELSRLTTLRVRGTKVTEAGKQNLQRHLPMLDLP